MSQNPDLSVSLCGIEMRNPFVTASGTCGFGRELANLYDLTAWGAFTTKSVTLVPRAGNPTPRIAECTSGILCSVGIQNQGVSSFLEKDLPFLRQFKMPVIASIAGNNVEDFPKLAAILDRHEGFSAIEVNISCPNLHVGGCTISMDPALAGQVIRMVKMNTRFPVIAKLANVTEIVSVAQSVEENGADAVSLINCIPGMAIDIQTQRPKLANITGGLVGPAIKPAAIKSVWEVYRSVHIPIIGLGGITAWNDVVEFLLAGATVVGIGSALFGNPHIIFELIEGLTTYMQEKGFSRLDEFRGKVFL